MITQSGWHTNVWAAMTSAPTFNLRHSSTNAGDLFSKIKGLLANEYAIGSATVSTTSKNLVQGHAYSVLNVYEVSLSSGAKQKLYQVFNPWNRETWRDNPWAEGNSRWTDALKKQVDFENKNDGAFYLTPEDYFTNFGYTNWAEV